MPIEEKSRSLFPPYIPHEIEIPPWRVDDLLRHTAERYPDHVAMSFYREHWTYLELWRQANLMARALQDRGVKSGDRIALMLPNCPHYVIAYYAILLTGGIVTQINPLLVERELSDLLNDSGSTVIVVLDALVPRVLAVKHESLLKWVIGVAFQGSVEEPAVEGFFDVIKLASSKEPAPVSLDPARDVAVLQYTGGTTGRPKGAMLTHRNLVANVLQCYQFNQDGLYFGEDCTLAVIPLFHVYGMTVCMNLSVYLGSKMIILPRFDVPEVLNAIKTHRPSSFPGVPTMYVGLLQAPNLDDYAVESIRICNSGSAPMPVELMHLFEQRTGSVILEGYGLSESSPVTHSNPYWGKRKPGTIGIAMPSTECRIVDLKTACDVEPGELGELWIRGPQVMKGYWNQPQETADTLTEGWLHTGDVASYDEEGYVVIMDRLKDVIIASGYNVYPREIEEILYQHPGVLEAAVVGAPDSYRGETVRAVIVPKFKSGLTIETLADYLKANLAPYKVPKIIEFRDALPKSAVGKILRRVVRDEGA